MSCASSRATSTMAWQSVVGWVFSSIATAKGINREQYSGGQSAVVGSPGSQTLVVCVGGNRATSTQSGRSLGTRGSLSGCQRLPAVLFCKFLQEATYGRVGRLAFRTFRTEATRTQGNPGFFQVAHCAGTRWQGINRYGHQSVFSCGSLLMSGATSCAWGSRTASRTARQSIVSAVVAALCSIVSCVQRQVLHKVCRFNWFARRGCRLVFRYTHSAVFRPRSGSGRGTGHAFLRLICCSCRIHLHR
jgi:hypothetical protein